ncbi:CCPG1 protein, partial [Furnarius figulus]|nr:CCPG1 protein [Furnarius figulus]
QGSDIETVTSENGSTNDNQEFVSEEYVSLQEEEQAIDLQAQCDNDEETPVVDNTLSGLEETQAVPEGKEEKIPDDRSCIGTISDDSDIVTLEAPKPEEAQSQEEEAPADGEEAQSSEDFNMGSSSSSQYTFSHVETVFPSPASNAESSSDETSSQSSPTVRKRRPRKRLVSSSEAEALPEQEPEPPREEQHKRQFSSGLNRCIILALVIAISMGFGHFYGTVQIQKRQQLVTKTRELKDMKDDLYQCQQEQGDQVHHKAGSLKGDPATCLTFNEVEKKSFDSQKKSLAAENQHLRESLEKEEKALASLQEELRKLRQQIRNLEDKGTSTESIVMENQKLREHLEEEKQRNSNFLRQKETLFAEAQMLRRELDKERHVTEALKKELEQLSSRQTPGSANDEDDDTLRENQEIETLRGRLVELEKKLNFEQQRSDLWEKLYVEAKDQTEKQEINENGQKKGAKGQSKMRKKSKDSFFGSVKETFDAMKNSTKEFVRHHKEKIKQAKEAVKENLKKFSDSVKSTFRHFKDSTKNIFDEKEKSSNDKRYEANKKARNFYRDYNSYENQKHTHHRGPSMPKEFKSGRKHHFTAFEKDADSQKCLNDDLCNRKHHFVPKGCSGIFECAHQEFISLFNRVSDPIRVDEFHRLMKKYLQQVVHNFHHWRELESFINKFFHNGLFIHDQMLFTDFVNDVKDYLEDMKEYQSNNEKVFEDLDKYVYRYYFHYDNSPQYGPSRPKRPSFTQTENSRHEKQAQKYHHRNKREGKWHKHGRTNGRHMANLEIELGQLPFDPKY